MKHIILKAALAAAACFFLHPVNAAQTLTKATGELVCAYTSIAVGDGGKAVVTCAGPAVVTPPPPPPPVDTVPVPPPPCGRDIPFARYLAEGHTGKDGLYWIILFSGWGNLNDCEFEAAYRAGYPREEARSGGAPVDLSYRWGPVIAWDPPGDLYYLSGSGGTKTFNVPPGYVGMVALETVANTNSKHESATATLDGRDPETIGGNGGRTHFVSLAPGVHSYTVSLSQAGGCTVVLRHYP